MTVHRILCEIEIDQQTFNEYVPPKGIDVCWFWEYKGLRAQDRGSKALALFMTSDKNPIKEQRHTDLDILAEVKKNRCFRLIRENINYSDYADILPPQSEPVMEFRAILSDPNLDKRMVDNATDIQEVEISDEQMAFNNARRRQRGMPAIEPKEGTKTRKAMVKSLTGRMEEKPVHVYDVGVVERG